MRFEKFIKDWKSSLAENLFLRSVTLILAIGLILNASVFKKREIVVVTPPQVTEEYWIGKKKASSEYIEQMAVFFSTLAGNLSPTNATYNVSALLRYVTPKLYGDIKNSLMADAISVVKNNMTQTFFPRNVKVNGNEAVVEGDTIRKFGSARATKETMIYNMKFVVDNYKIYLEEFYVDYPERRKKQIFMKEGITNEEKIKEQFKKLEKGSEK